MDIEPKRKFYLVVLTIYTLILITCLVSCNSSQEQNPSIIGSEKPSNSDSNNNNLSAPTSQINDVHIAKDFGDKKYGGIMTLANRGNPPAGFDTLRTSSIALHHVAGAIFGPGNLVMRCRDNTYLVCPYLARSWISDQSFTKWTFNIRNDVFWHDGTPFTADDAKFWFELAFFGYEVGEKSRAPAYFKTELGTIENIEVHPNNRLTIIFTDRNPHFLEILANPRFKIAHPSHLMKPKLASGDMSVSPLDIGLVGLGPFVIDKYESNSLISVKRNDLYWEKSKQGNQLPYLDGINYVITKDPFAMDIAFRSGRIDGGARGQSHYLSSNRKEKYVEDLPNEVFFAEVEGVNFRLAFNMMKDGPWHDPKVRRAIALWINKTDAIPIVLNGFGWTSPDLGPPNIAVQRHFINWPKFDLGDPDTKRAEALTLMSESHYPNGFSMGHLCRSLNPKPCEFLKDQLSGLGITLELNMTDESEWNRGRTSLDYDSQQGRLTPSQIPEGTQSVYGRYENNPDAYAKHNDKHVENLYKLLKESLTLEHRIEIWRDIERYLFKDKTYIIPIAEYINVIPYRTYVKGLAIPAEDAHANTDFSTVWMEK